MEYDVRLKSSELALIRRGLKMYAKQYRRMQSESKVGWEKEESQKRIDACNALHNKLVTGLSLADDQPACKPVEK